NALDDPSIFVREVIHSRIHFDYETRNVVLAFTVNRHRRDVAVVMCEYARYDCDAAWSVFGCHDERMQVRAESSLESVDLSAVDNSATQAFRNNFNRFSGGVRHHHLKCIGMQG